ncbi:MAG: hypothetical protein KME02_02025 [Aphanothece saxicola GSE-SYN-MK-01-06B]|nr:hypothetical protein [Aphanothece saxicola GSE-SYN-MK-01-06B]
MLAPQAASALDFTFSFGTELSGLITGLVDNETNRCNSGSTIGCSVSVSTGLANGGTNNANGITGAGPYTPAGVGDESGFTVIDGVITEATWFGVSSSGPLYLLNFSSIGGSSLSFGVFQEAFCVVDRCIDSGIVQFSAITTPTPSVPSVPAPLPVLGAAAAFGYSRKLRKRIKSSKMPVTSAIN